jgi:hypothetical protein
MKFQCMTTISLDSHAVIVSYTDQHSVLLTVFLIKCEVQCKAVPLQVRGGTEGSRKLRFPDFLVIVSYTDQHSVLLTVFLIKCEVQCKAVPLQVRGGAEGSRKLRFPDFMTTAQDGGKVVIIIYTFSIFLYMTSVYLHPYRATITIALHPSVSRKKCTSVEITFVKSVTEKCLHRQILSHF